VKIYNGLETFKKVKNVVLTTGTFDGVHLGHQVIIDQLKGHAQKIGGETVVLTFFPHPRMVLYPENNDLRLINTIGERKKLLEKAGVDHLIIHPFSKEFSQLTSLEYVRNILVNQLEINTLVVGYDHHFGKNREGSFVHLKEFGDTYGFTVQEIPVQEVQQINISSTKIRNSLINGEINAANQFLGYPYLLNGTVVEGNQIGREIGFPTANIKVDEWYKLIPASGVYAVKIWVNQQKYIGMLNIGNRPTLNGKEQTIEVNIFNFNENIYNKAIQIEFYERIRSEQKFEELFDLKKQLTLDKEKTIQVLAP